ncbi:MAG: hypothetical protein WD534_11605 [Phycisphaeraceae bacterium]
MSDIIWQPYFSPLPILAGAVLLAVLALAVYGQTFRAAPLLSSVLVVMRLLLVALLAGLLMGPSVLPRQSSVPDRPVLTLLVDASASMQQADMAGSARFDFLREQWLSDERLTTLRRDHDVRVIAFDATPRPLAFEQLARPASEVAVGRTSQVIASVRQTLAEMPGEAQGASIVLFSDGRDSDETPAAAAAQLARSRSTPIHSVPLGGPSLQRDLALVATPRQAYLLAGEEGQIDVELIQTNGTGVRTTLHVRGGAEPEARPVAFDRQSRQRVTVPIQQTQPGVYAYELELAAVEGEIEKRNNTQTVFVEVTDQRLEVLVLEGEPYWDTKFLAQSLRKDDRIALTQVTQVSLRQQKRIVTRSDSGGGLPATLEELAAYDVVVLGRGVENLLTPEVAALLPRYVSEQGGQVVFSRGRAYEPGTSAGRAMGRELAVLEPVVWGDGSLRDQQVVLAEQGRVHPSFATITAAAGRDVGELVGELPGLTTLPEIARVKASARVLARARPAGAVGGDVDLAGAGEGVGQPVLLVMPYGRGQVVTLAGEGLWRWSLHERHVETLEGVFDRFWSNMIRWLAMGSDFQPGQEIALRLSEPTVRLGDAVEVELSSRSPLPPGAQPVLRLIGPGEANEQRALRTGPGSSRQRESFTAEAAGVYRVVLEAGPLTPEPVEARFSVYDVDMERLQSAAHPALMRQLAEESGGQLLDPHEPDQLQTVLADYRAARIVPPQPEPIWDRGWLLLLLLLWAGGEWLMRKKGGLL